MINRRQAIVAIGVAALSGGGSFTVSGVDLPGATDDTLHADLARMGSRVYSEEGVPMFLACQNPAGHGTAPVPSALNRKVAAAFHRYTEEWQHIRPDAPASDVAKIIELLAERDFAKGGTELGF